MSERDAELAGLAAEVARLRQVLDDMADRERRYRMLAEHASDVVWEIDEAGHFAWISDSITRVLGWEPADLIGKDSILVVHPDQLDFARANRERLLRGHIIEAEFRIRTADGDYKWMALRAHAMPTERGISRVATLRDIDDEIAAREKLERVTRHDVLTGLQTRTATIDALARAHASSHGQTGVLCVGVDKLGRVNEALGHPAGDLLLVRVAERIVKTVRDPELVGRGGGDEFIVVVPNLGSAGDASIVAERIRGSVLGFVEVGGREVEPSVSIGVTIGSGADADADALLREASLAMRAAKAKGGNCVEFGDPQMAAEAQRALELEEDMQQGLRGGQFTPWYQPIVDLRSGNVIGYEALARWTLPDGEILIPADFMSVAARSALIVRLDEVIVRQALRTLSALPAPMFLAVNTSTASLAHPGFADLVTQVIADAGVDPSRLHLEVTETELIGSIEAIRRAMSDLAAVGVRWYVDDFGTGYSSISHLRDLPITGLKLDKSFTDAMRSGDERGTRLAQGLAGLANGLGLRTVAEGIETEAQARHLPAQGWGYGQGWLFGVAAPDIDTDGAATR